MEKLTKKEEEIMRVIWKLEKAFIQDIVDDLPEPKLHYNTISTVVKFLHEKKFVEKRKYGNMYQYHPLVSQEDYKSEAMDDMAEKFFDNSYTNMIAHFASKEKISEEELKDILESNGFIILNEKKFDNSILLECVVDDGDN